MRHEARYPGTPVVLSSSPTPVDGLAPIPDPQAEAEAAINAEIKSSIKMVLTVLVEGFDRSPIRTLRLLEQYAMNQRETLAALAIDDEPDKTRGFGDGTAGLMGIFREGIEIYRERMAEVAKSKPPRTPLDVVADGEGMIDADTLRHEASYDHPEFEEPPRG